MRFTSFRVSNFRAIDWATLDDLQQTVVIAGQNGCGKSTLLDAVRLFKSAYGDYHGDELQQWCGELNVRADGTSLDLEPLLRDPSRPLEVYATLSLTSEEKQFIADHAFELLRDLRWKGAQPASRPGQRKAKLIDQFRAIPDPSSAEAQQFIEECNRQLEESYISGTVTLDRNRGVVPSTSPLLSLIFTTYNPDNLGIIEFQPSQRIYAREQVTGVNFASKEQSERQHALYNSAQKYQSLKTQLTASYVKELIASQGKSSAAQNESLTESLQELFRFFIPDKEFLGLVPNPNGSFRFPVRTAGGKEHDIDELSAGEKEVVFGYLRLKSLSPRNSVLLIDEPELHLNPRLLGGLLDFYHRHVGVALGNQLWVVTHSDVIVKEACVDKPGVSVFHMASAESRSSGRESQAKRLNMHEDLQTLLVQLVGASIQPGRKVVIFEGGGDSEFDQTMCGDLFPEFRLAVNMLSGTNRTQVRRLHDVLDRASRSLQATFYSIVDRDSEPDGQTAARTLQWDAYHIENYLLDPEYVHEALRSMQGTACSLASPEETQEALRACAEQEIPSLVATRLARCADRQLTECIRLPFTLSKGLSTVNLVAAIRGSLERLNEIAITRLSLAALTSKEEQLRDELLRALEDGSWRRVFPGRRILQEFVSRHGKSMFRYEAFRNQVLTCMKRAGHKPNGMQREPVRNSVCEVG